MATCFQDQKLAGVVPWQRFRDGFWHKRGCIRNQVNANFREFRERLRLGETGRVFGQEPVSSTDRRPLKRRNAKSVTGLTAIDARIGSHPASGYTGAEFRMNIFAPGPTPDSVRSADGNVLTPPKGWTLLPPGDAALTRRVKTAGDHWIVQEKKGRKVFSRGVWAAAATIDKIRAELETERSCDGYVKRKEADARRRDKAQAEYVEDFYGEVVTFLAFHPKHADVARRLARAVTEHATPVGSGTVARTKRIPVEQRAEAAVIAWMRHQTTAYESMAIPRVKGKRREVRRMLAQRSQELLGRYRRGEAVGEECPLRKAFG